MVLRKEAIRDRVKKLREILANLEEVREVSEEEFISSYKHYWLAERGLQLAADTVFDIGNHILAGYYKTSPEDYEEILDLLQKKGVLSKKLRERMKGLGGFRNILVHEYLKIDERKVYRELQTGLTDLEDFISEVVKWMEGI